MVEALLEIVRIFQRHKLAYCLVGGLAVMLHQGRANTIDIDFYVLVEDLKKVRDILKAEKAEAETRGEYQLKARIGTVPIDILLADHYIGADVVHRSIEKKLGDTFVRIATPEDL